MIPYGKNPELDALYDELSVAEQREIDAKLAGRRDLLPEIGEAMLPLKAKINEIEGQLVYPEASAKAASDVARRARANLGITRGLILAARADKEAGEGATVIGLSLGLNDGYRASEFNRIIDRLEILND